MKPKPKREPKRKERRTNEPSEPEPQLSHEQLLEQLAQAARQCAEFEKQLGQNAAPELESIIKLHRILAMTFSLEARQTPELLKLVKELMTSLMGWAQLEERRRQIELAERKYHDLAETRSREATGEKAKALSPGTLETIENDLSLL